MKIAVLGLGYLGAVHAASMASLGHHVIGIDPQPQRVAQLNAAQPPFHEPGFAALLADGVRSGNLHFSTDPQSITDAELVFLTVGTPQLAQGDGADLSQIHTALEDLIPMLTPASVVVGKSTVPVGTVRKLAERLAHAVPGAALAWNPEFLREGAAIQDSLQPDRVVYGLPDQPELAARAEQVLNAAYSLILHDNIPVLKSNYETAELIKVAANAFLATKISFINAFSEISEHVGADVTQLADALGHDARIGRRFLNAGLGFGGGCLPKDIRALIARTRELGLTDATGLFTEADRINLRQRQRVVETVLAEVSDQPHPQSVAILGLSFKPESDDVRDSPALELALALQAAGVHVRVTDPIAMPTAQNLAPTLSYAETPEAAVRGASVVILATEWNEFLRSDPHQLLASTEMTEPLLLDARNALSPEEWTLAGWRYRGIGRWVPQPR